MKTENGRKSGSDEDRWVEAGGTQKRGVDWSVHEEQAISMWALGKGERSVWKGQSPFPLFPLAYPRSLPSSPLTLPWRHYRHTEPSYRHKMRAPHHSVSDPWLLAKTFANLCNTRSCGDYTHNTHISRCTCVRMCVVVSSCTPGKTTSGLLRARRARNHLFPSLSSRATAPGYSNHYLLYYLDNNIITFHFLLIQNHASIKPKWLSEHLN